MKYKTIILALIILIIACSAQSVFAEDATAGKHTMTVPDGYGVQDNTSSRIEMGDDNHTTYIKIGFDVSQTPDEVKTNVEGSGSKFVKQTNYNYAGYNITQFDFTDSNGHYQYIYYCQKGKDTIGINLMSTHTYSAVGDNGNPVTSILSSIKS